MWRVFVVPALVVAGVAVSLSWAGGVGTIEHRYDHYDPSFIRQVGTGSVAVASVLSRIQAAHNSRTPGNFAAPQLQHPAELLLKGELSKLTNRDYAVLDEAVRGSRSFREQMLATISRSKSHALAQRVQPSMYRNLSRGTKRFARTWNAYLGALVHALDSAVTLSSFGPTGVKELRTLLTAARSGSQSRFEALRKKDVETVVKVVRGAEKSCEA
jgi:hypothetical protein